MNESKMEFWKIKSAKVKLIPEMELFGTNAFKTKN